MDHTKPNCEACGAPILWVRTAKEKWMPLNPTQVPNGNMEVKDGVATFWKAEPSVERYVSHYSSCPAAKELRRQRKAAEE